MELIELCKEVGFSGPYLVISRPLDVDPKLRKPLGTCRFEGGNSQILCSITTPEVAGGGLVGRMGGLRRLREFFWGGDVPPRPSKS